MIRQFTINKISISEINKVKNQLEKYRNNLQRKTRTFVSKLAERGITVARVNGSYVDEDGVHDNMITFRKTLEGSNGDETAIILATSSPVQIVWDGGNSAEINPLLMAEFGSGWNAINPLGVLGVGQGTFPGQTHAFDTDGWYWRVDGELHHSVGALPHQPMWKAIIEMHREVNAVIREVWS